MNVIPVQLLVIIILGLCFASPATASEKEALNKIKRFGKTLKKELKKGLDSSPIDAVKVCNTKAPEIQKMVSSDKIKIGRVSRKNRNPKNNPKSWMLESIDGYHKGEIKKTHVVVKLENGKHGLLKPIKTKALCLNCHGQYLQPVLNKEIQKHYPNDKATGYQIGDIRGFFWAEY